MFYCKNCATENNWEFNEKLKMSDTYCEMCDTVDTSCVYEPTHRLHGKGIPSPCKNYRDQNGCHNCDTCVTIWNHDEGYKLFCNADKSQRPLSGSCAMKEFDYEHVGEIMEKWDEWAKFREVEPYGTCDYWKLNRVEKTE